MCWIIGIRSRGISSVSPDLVRYIMRNRLGEGRTPHSTSSSMIPYIVQMILRLSKLIKREITNVPFKFFQLQKLFTKLNRGFLKPE